MTAFASWRTARAARQAKTHDPAPGARRFSDAVLNAVSPETRKSLHAFAESIARAEGVLREYHAAVPSAFTG
jgi:hypothetical protein